MRQWRLGLSMLKLLNATPLMSCHKKFYRPLAVMRLACPALGAVVAQNAENIDAGEHVVAVSNAEPARELSWRIHWFNVTALIASCFLFEVQELICPFFSSSTLQLASGQRQPKQAKNEKGKGKGPDGGSSADASNSGLLKDTLRLTLQSQQMIRSAFDATTIAILYSQEDDKHELSNLMNSGLNNSPNVTSSRSRTASFQSTP